MQTGQPALNHSEQEDAVERIHALMQQGMSSGEAIAIVAADIRANHKGEQVVVMFDDEDDE